MKHLTALLLPVLMMEMTVCGDDAPQPQRPMVQAGSTGSSDNYTTTAIPWHLHVWAKSKEPHAKVFFPCSDPAM